MDIEAELLNLPNMTSEELENQVREKIASFHGFLNREVALRLIAKEKGVLKPEEKTYKLADIPKGEKKLTFNATVRKIWPTATYSSGKRSRVIEVSDGTIGTAAMPLVLWNDDVELAIGMRVKDELVVRGAYERSGELHLGYSGKVEISKKSGFTDLSAIADRESDAVHAYGVIKKLEGYDRFVRDSNTIRGAAFLLSDSAHEVRCVLLDRPERIDQLREGDEVILEGAVVVKGNLDITGATRMLSRRASEMLLGEVNQLEQKDRDLILLQVGSKQVTLDRPNALKFMGVEVADDILLSTVVELRKSSILNSRVAVKIEEKDNQIFIRS